MREGRTENGDVGQQRHPQTARPAGAAWAAVGRRRHFFCAEFVLAIFGCGRTLELGRTLLLMMLLLLLQPPAAPRGSATG